MNLIAKFNEWKESLPEWAKQVGDQSLHVGLGAATVVWLYNVTSNMTISVATPALLWGMREVRQWPSAVWYDPYLDWSFQALGLVVGFWLSE